MYFRRFPLYHIRYEICVRRRYVSSEKSGRDGKDPATCVLFRECHLPLPGTRVCGAPFLQCLGAWGGLVPHCERCRRLCSVAPTMARVREAALGQAAHASRTRSGARSDECLLLPGDLSYPIGNCWSHRVPWSHHTCSARGTHPPQHCRIASSCRRWMAPDGCALRRAATWLYLCLRQLCLLHAVRGARPPDRPGRGRSRD